MTTLIPTGTSRRRSYVSQYRLTFLRTVRSEWIKLTSLRSTWWSLAVTAVISIGFAAIFAALLAFSVDQGAAPIPGAGAGAVLGPTQYTMLLAGALGATTVTGEYASGMIRSTLTAVPRRGLLVAGKATAVGVLMVLSAVVTFAASALLTAPILGEQAIDWSEPGLSWEPLALGVLAMVCIALIGTGIGLVVRSGPGAVSLTVGLLLVLPVLPALVPPTGLFGWVHGFGDYLPVAAAQSLMAANASPALSFGIALATLLGWTAAGLIGGYAVLRSRDA